MLKTDLMFLVYYRLYITYTLAGFLFDLDQSNICRDIQKIAPLIRNCLPIPQKLYNIKRRRHDYDIYKEYHPLTLKQVVNVVDLGYLGIEKDFPQQLSSIPH